MATMETITNNASHNQLDQAAVAGMMAELNSILERAREERFRLIRTVKDCEAKTATTGVNPAADGVAKLAVHINALDEAVNSRFAKLQQAEVREQKRMEKITRLEQSIAQMAGRVEKQVDRAQNIDQDVARISRQIHSSADRALGSATEKLEKINSRIDARIMQLRDTEENLTGNMQKLQSEVKAASEGIDSHINQTVMAARQQTQTIASKFNDATVNIESQIEQSAAYMRDEADRTKQMITDATGEALNNYNQLLESAFEAAATKVDELTEPMQEKLDEQFNEYASKLDPMFEGVKRELDAIFDRSKLDAEELMLPVYEKLQSAYDHVDEHAKGIVDNFVGQIDEQFNERLEQHETAYVAKSEEMIASQEETFASRSSELEMLINSTHEKLSGLLAEKENMLQAAIEDQSNHKLADATASLDKALTHSQDEIDKHFDRSRKHFVSQLEDKLSGMRSRADKHAAAAVTLLQATVDQKADAATSKATEKMEALESSFKAQLDKTDSRIESVTDSLQARFREELAKYSESANGEADAVAERIHSQVSSKIEQAAERFRVEAESMIEPLVKQMANQVAEFNHRADDAADTAKTRMETKLSEQKKSITAMTDLVEKHITRKLQSVKPAANKQLEETETQLRDRVSEMQQGAQSLMDMVEKQISHRIANLEPRITDAVHSAQDFLRTQLEQLEAEIQSSLAPMRSEVSDAAHTMHEKMTTMIQEPELHVEMTEQGEVTVPAAQAETIEDLDDDGLAARIVPVESDDDESPQQIIVHTPKSPVGPSAEMGVSSGEMGEVVADDEDIEKAA
ncbi:hypothetical protein JD969_01720 [Planctomycetota bacterium]|nr:hypothetical protein JD969_01720 [Planctomycetota bacterium]